MEQIILASQSPRRKELMNLLPWSFEVVTKEVVEVMDLACSPEENVKMLALQKAEAVSALKPNQLVIGADTIVCIGGEMLGKPRDAHHAMNMLESLSGKWHQVLTGVALVMPSKGIKHCFYVETKVCMQELTSEEIKAYIETKEPFDKAGGYGIQGYGAKHIERIEGDYYNVMGLPLHALYSALKELEERI